MPTFVIIVKIFNKLSFRLMTLWTFCVKLFISFHNTYACAPKHEDIKHVLHLLTVLIGITVFEYSTPLGNTSSTVQYSTVQLLYLFLMLVAIIIHTVYCIMHLYWYQLIIEYYTVVFNTVLLCSISTIQYASFLIREI